MGPGSQWIKYSDECSHRFRVFDFSWSISCPLLEGNKEAYFPLSLKLVTFYKALNKMVLLLAKEWGKEFI